MEYAAFTEYCHRFPAYLRNFFWVDPDAPMVVPVEKKDSYFPSSQWFVSSGKTLSFAAKAGYNDEPHNHNDIGTFLLVCDEGQILCDYGSGEYTRDYFQDATRYTYLCNSSFGHSLPIINGTGQLPGKQYRGRVISHNGGTFQVDMTDAYGVESLISAIRRMELSEDSFALKDTFEGTDLSITERFVTMIPPMPTPEGVILGQYRLETVSGITPSIHAETIINHEGLPDTLYLIDYELGTLKEFALQVFPVL